jgi:hypothetical protein
VPPSMDAEKDVLLMEGFIKTRTLTIVQSI